MAMNKNKIVKIIFFIIHYEFFFWSVLVVSDSLVLSQAATKNEKPIKQITDMILNPDFPLLVIFFIIFNISLY